jgi:hypothetical protein
MTHVSEFVIAKNALRHIIRRKNRAGKDAIELPSISASFLISSGSFLSLKALKISVNFFMRLPCAGVQKALKNHFNSVTDSLLIFEKPYVCRLLCKDAD